MVWGSPNPPATTISRLSEYNSKYILCVVHKIGKNGEGIILKHKSLDPEVIFSACTLCQVLSWGCMVVV